MGVGVNIILFALFRAIFLLDDALGGKIDLNVAMMDLVTVLVFVVLRSSCCERFVVSISVVTMTSIVVGIPDLVGGFDRRGTRFFVNNGGSFSVFVVPNVFVVLLGSLRGGGGVAIFSILVAVFDLFAIFLNNDAAKVVISVYAILLLLLTVGFHPGGAMCLTMVLVVCMLLVMFARFLLGASLVARLLAGLKGGGALASEAAV